MLDIFRKKETVKVQLGEAEIVCKPYESRTYAITKIKTLSILNELKQQRLDELENGVETQVPNLDDNDVFTGLFNCIFNVELAKLVILKWSNIGIKGKAVPVTPENIELLFEDGFLQEQFYIQYMKKQIEIEEEKK